jgi:broad specificity phosphatase PhoE
MKTVLLARHGETTGNSRGLILGRKEYPLTERGIRTTSKLADIIKERIPPPPGAPFPLGDGFEPWPRVTTAIKGIIISSPLGRAVESARIYAGRTGWQIEVVAAMAELSSGEWEGQPRALVAPGKPFIRTTWEDRPPGGEGYLDGESRLAGTVLTIRGMDDYDIALVVGHAGINRVFLKLWLGADSSDMLNVHQSHEMIYVMNGGAGVRWIDAHGATGQGLIKKEKGEVVANDS